MVSEQSRVGWAHCESHVIVRKSQCIRHCDIQIDHRAWLYQCTMFDVQAVFKSYDSLRNYAFSFRNAVPGEPLKTVRLHRELPFSKYLVLGAALS